MRISNAFRLATLASTLITVSAVAQTRFCMGGDLEHLSAAQKASCSSKLQAVKSTATALGAPDGWHFVVVCGESGWSNYAAFANGDSAALQNVVADTNFEQRETFLRSDRLDLQNPASFKRTLAREVAQVVLRSHDEVAIDHQVDLLMSRTPDRSGY